jgi:hypothetical protein
MKAFLFGGDSNGKTLDIENCRDVIDMPKNYKRASYDETEKPSSMIYEFDRYIRYDEKFRKQLSNSGAVVEMENLGIFIHNSFSKDEIESLSKIILMVIRAQWKPVKPYL